MGPGASSDGLIRNSGPLALQVLKDRIQDQKDQRKPRQAPVVKSAFPGVFSEQHNGAFLCSP